MTSEMVRPYFPLLVWLLSCCTVMGQMPQQGDTLYGNEWIDENASYYRISIPEDGLYRLSTQQLIDAGIPVNEIKASEYRMFHLGEEIPLHISSNQELTQGDFIEFKGEKNRNELDRFLYRGGTEDQLNPHYSLINDTAAYYLSWKKGTSGKRYRTFEYGSIAPNLPEQDWYYQSIQKSYSNRHVKPYTKVGGINVSRSRYIEGEGYASDFSGIHVIEYSLDGLRMNAGPTTCSISLVGSYSDHHLQIRANDSLLFEDSMDVFGFRSLNLTIPKEYLTQDFTITIEGKLGNSDQYALGHITLNYPRSTASLESPTQKLIVPARDSSLIRWDNLSNTEEYIFYRPDQNQRILPGLEGGSPAFPLGSSDQDEAAALYTVDDIKTSPLPRPVQMKTYADEGDHDFIILTSRRFRNTHIDAYAQYRSSDVGGSYNPIIIDVEELYDSYAYGISRHPIAVRNFMHYIDEHWEADPYVFIIGKGRQYDDLRTPAQVDKAIQMGFYVPSFGSPGSDNLMLSSNNTSAPIFPLGRLAVSEPHQVNNYLQKIQVMESYSYDGSVENSEWLREVIHLNGGTADVDEIAKYFDRMVDTLHSSPWNPRISTIFRTSNEPVQTEDMEEIFNKINRGTNLVNYFGHSSATTLAIDINRPDAFKNYDKMPFLLTLGCNAGNLNIEGESLGETYVLYEGKGFIGSWASGHYGILQILGVLSQKFYRHYAKDLRGEPIGKIIQQTLLENQDIFPRHAAQMMLMCDPAYDIPMPTGTDLTIDPSSIKTSPEAIPTTRDSFTVRFSVANLGLRSDQNTHLQLVREFPDGARDSLPIFNFDVPDQKKTFELRLPVGGNRASGFNRLYLEVDPLNTVDERPLPHAEGNNSFVSADSTPGYAFLIEDKRIRPLLPDNFKIVPRDTVTLVASGTRHSDEERSILIQIDTTEQFNSSQVQTFRQTIRGNTMRQDVQVRENQVYYWRSTAKFSSVDTNWADEVHSFIHLPGKEGWNQSHRGQFLQDSMKGLQVHPKEGYFWLDTTLTSYNLKNQYYLSSDEWLYITHDYGHVRQGPFWLGGFTGAYVIVIDPITTLLGMKNPPGGAFGSYNPGGEKRSFAYFTDDSTSRRDLMNFIADTIPDSMFVIFTLNPFSLGDSYGVEDWQADSLRYNGRNLFNFFEQYGAKDIRKLKSRGSVPYTFMFRKQDRAYGEGIAQDQDETIVTEGLFRVLRDSGRVRTPWIGPMSRKDSLSWQVGNPYWFTDDEMYIRVFSNDEASGRGQAVDTLFLQEGDSSVIIPTSDDKYYALELYAEDFLHKTVPPLHYWRLFYTDSIPELIFDPETKYHGPSDTVHQGYRDEFELAIRNVGADMRDSFEATYRVIDDRNQWIISGSRTMAPLDEGDYSTLQFQIDSDGATGEFSILVHINPDERIDERSFENNVYQEDFYIRPDRIAPQLEVLFDDRFLTDYEPIRKDPIIEVRLEDSNPEAPIQQKSAIEWSIEQPDGSIYPLNPTDPEVQFTPSTGQSDTATWKVQADFTMPGIYEMQVNGSDRAGNAAGETDYTIHFTIQEEVRISYLANFPNPLSTYTRFRYILESGEPLTDYSIEIFNVEGRRVRILTEEDLGILYPGERYTEGYWRGTDESGSPLNAGVYFYKLFPDSHEPDHLPRSYDSFFEDGWGRMTIIR